MSQEIAINIQFEGNTQPQEEVIFQLPSDTSWADLEAMLKAQFDCDAIKVQYIDTDADYITIGSNEELKEAFRMAYENCRSVLVLKVRDLTQDTEVWTIDDMPPPIPQRCPIIQPVVPAATLEVNDDEVVAMETRPENYSRRMVENLFRGYKDTEFVSEVARRVSEANGNSQDNSEEVNVDLTSGGNIIGAGHIDSENLNVAIATKTDVDKEIDSATGEAMTVMLNNGDVAVNMVAMDDVPKVELKRDEETGAESPKLPDIVKKKTKRKEKRTPEFNDSRRLTQSADRLAKPRRNVCDSESGETSHDDTPMPYSVFVKFMQQLKFDLRQEIVKDVTRKTVKQVLKGLDGAVIHSLQGANGVPIVPPVLDDSAKESKESKDPTSSHPVYYHEGIVCDFCERSIVGVRYKCCNCADYDLCEECEAIHGVHDSDHVFLKLRKPVRLGGRTVILKNTIYKKYKTSDSTHNEEGAIPPKPTSFEDVLRNKMESRLQEKTARKQEKLRKREERIVEKQRRKEEKLKRRLECHRDHPTKRERLDLPAVAKPVNKELDASFVCDVTVPDGTCVQPGTKLQKTWKMKNTGTKEWTDNTKLRLVYGSIPTPSNDIEVPRLQPDEECDVTVELQAPERPGKYQSHWKMFDSGTQFGHRVWCEITVEPKEVLEPIREDSLKCLIQSEEETTPLITASEKQEEHELPSIEKNDTQQNETAQKVSDLMTEQETFRIPQQVEEKETSEDLLGQVPQQEDETPALGDKQLEKDLSTAVAQLKIDSQPESEQTGQDLMSFEMVDYAQRGTPKISQTATPTNTPLDISPPKSPVPEVEYKPLSSSSSVELVNAEQEEDQQQMNLFVEDFMSKFQVPKPEIDEDIESISTLSDSSLSEDDDFLIVPLPACFDFSKPILRSTTADVGRDQDNNVDDNHNNIPSAYSEVQTEGQSIDDLFGPSDAPAATQSPNPAINTDQQNTETEQNDEGEIEVISEPQEKVFETTDSVDVQESSSPDETREADISGEEEETPRTEEEEITETKEPLSYDNYAHDFGASAAVPDNVVIERLEEKGATGHEQKGQKSEHNPGEFVNQIMTTAVNAANKAAANAYTTCKEVFYTWQAKHYQGGSGKWKPSENKYTPSQSTWEPKGEKWTPKEDKYVPRASTWTPPKETWKPPAQNMSESVSKSPESKLMEMGFCNRELNRQLLDKHDNDVEAVVQELLGGMDNDWMNRRH